MFLKNDFGEFVNVNKIVAVTAESTSKFTHEINLHTKNGAVDFLYDNNKKYKDAHNAIQELLIHGPKYKQRPWTNTVKWICVKGNMFLLEQIECILMEGWIVEVRMTDITITIENHNDDELEKCLNAFDVALRDNGQIINLDGWETEN